MQDNTIIIDYDLLREKIPEVTVRDKLMMEPLLRLELENYTPIMVGDYRGFSREKLMYNNYNNMIVTGVPNAQSILGKARWLSRVILASVNQDIRSHRSAEKCCFIRVKLSRGKEAKIPLIPFMYGFTSAEKLGNEVGGIDSWKSPYSLIVYVENAGAEISQIAKIKDKKISKKLKDRYNALLKRRREGHENEIELLKPLAEHSIRVKLLVYHDLQRIGKMVGGLSEEDLKSVTELYLASVIVVPVLLGLGKAANRGFGRFVIKEFNYNKNDKIQELLNKIQELKKSKPIKEKREIINYIQNTLLEIGQKAIESITGHRPPLLSWSNDSWPLADIPRIINHNNSIDIIRLNKFKLNKKYYNDLSPIEKAIEEIAQASTKYQWKELLNMNHKTRKKKKYSEPGLCVHTWPLGLPRSQPYKCKKVKTGYLFLNPSKDYTIIDNSFIINDKKWKDIMEKHNKHNKCGFFDDIGGRRQSMLIAFPLPGNSDGSVDVVVWLLPAGDLLDFLRDSDCSLYHAGPHRDQISRCEELVVKVSYAIRQDKVCVNNKKCKKGGIANPNKRNCYKCENKDINICYQDIISNALEFFKSSLEG